MKIVLNLLATIVACNAGLLGGNSANHVQVQVEPQHLHHVHQVQHVQQVQHIEPAPQHQVKIIKIQNVGDGGGYSGGSGGGYSYSGGHGGYGGGGYSQPQIIKVIHEQGPVSHGGYAVQGYSGGQSYATSQSSYQNSLESILPEILKIIFGNSGSSGYQGSYGGQLVDVYGSSGRAKINNAGSNSDYLRGGHVVEKGHLEVVEVRQNSGSGGGSSSSGGGLFGGKW